MSEYRDNIKQIQINDPVVASVANQPHTELFNNIQHVKARLEAQENLGANLMNQNNQTLQQITLINNRWSTVNTEIANLTDLINSVNSGLRALIQANTIEIEGLIGDVTNINATIDSITNEINALQTSLAGKVNRTGDTMIGNLLFEGNRELQWEGGNSITGNPSLLEIIAGNDLKLEFFDKYTLYRGSLLVQEYSNNTMKLYKDLNISGNSVRLAWTNATGNKGVRSYAESGTNTNAVVLVPFEGGSTYGSSKVGVIDGVVSEALYATATKYRKFSFDKLEVIDGAKNYKVHFDAANNRMVFNTSSAGDYMRFSTAGVAKFDINVLISPGLYVNKSYLDLDMQGKKIYNFQHIVGGELHNTLLWWHGGNDHARIHMVNYGADQDWLTIEMGDNFNDRIRFRTSSTIWPPAAPHDPLLDVGADGLWAYKNLSMGGKAITNMVMPDQNPSVVTWGRNAVNEYALAKAIECKRIGSGYPGTPTDWNNVLETGTYQGMNLANECPGSSRRFCMVMRHHDGWISQTMNDFGGTGIYQRNKVDGTWGSWRKLDWYPADFRTRETHAWNILGHTPSSIGDGWWYGYSTNTGTTWHYVSLVANQSRQRFTLGYNNLSDPSLRLGAWIAGRDATNLNWHQKRLLLEDDLPQNKQVGDVGTFAFLTYHNTVGPFYTISVGQFVPSSYLYFGGLHLYHNGTYGSFSSQGSIRPAGTWKALGYIAISISSRMGATLFLRVA